VPPPLAAELAAWVGTRPPEALVFAAPSARLYGLLRRACADLGIRRDGLHALRYGYAQRERAALLAAGLSPDEADAVVSQCLGHVRPRITRRYLARG
jgi:integrase